MLRQIIRPSLRPVSRSFPPSRTQLARRAFHHTHSSEHHGHNPRSSSYKCCRCIPIQTSSALLQIGPSFQATKRRPTSYHVPLGSSSHAFHSSRIVQGTPFYFIGLLSALKSSAILELIRTAGRVALTFIPVILVKNHTSRKLLQKIAMVEKESGDTTLPRPVKEFVARQGKLLQNIRRRTILFHALVFTPCILFWAAVIASLERTPLTGRWRLILLSPEEEDDIATQLAGPGWYRAVGDIISKHGTPKIVPPSDWRYTWVRDTLRTLEGVIPKLGDERSLGPVWLERGDDDIPLPPPADYPLRPRPRAAEYVRQLMQNNWSAPSHVIAGPPYSLIIVDDPNARNAFSYGFGPDGAGGIVVYSGFLDDILSKKNALSTEREPDGSGSGSGSGGSAVQLQPARATSSFWSNLFGGLFSAAPPLPAQHPPTAEQTTDLAILLAHELSHLVLSHHLETLSSMTIVVPGVLSLVSDFIRAFVFPITMLFGPFVNDAFADLGKAGSGELSKLGEYCTSMKQEIEADVVSARLLAHAGFDPRRAVQFWEDRADGFQGSECVASAAFDQAEQRHRESQSQRAFTLMIMGSGHPVNGVRVEKLREELGRWRAERERALTELQGVRVRTNDMDSDQARS